MDEMPQAGRALDVRVAIEVFGWERRSFAAPAAASEGVAISADASASAGRVVWTIDLGGPDYLVTPEGLPRYVRGAWPYGPESEIPYYSTDLAAAYAVMAKLGLALVPQSNGDEWAWMACDLTEVRYTGSTFVLVPRDGTARSAPTPMLAVCWAALASVAPR